MMPALVLWLFIMQAPGQPLDILNATFSSFSECHRHAELVWAARIAAKAPSVALHCAKITLKEVRP